MEGRVVTSTEAEENPARSSAADKVDALGTCTVEATCPDSHANLAIVKNHAQHVGPFT